MISITQKLVVDNTESKSIIDKADPTSLEIKLFVQDLADNLTDFLSRYGDRNTRIWNNIKSYFKYYVAKIQLNWPELPLVIIKSDLFGTNMNFIGSLGIYRIPLGFWDLRNPVKTVLQSLYTWLESFPLSISWDEFQFSLFDLLWATPKSLMTGLTPRRLEFLRFYASLNAESPYFPYRSNPIRRRNLFRMYNPVFDKSITIKDLNRNFNYKQIQHSDYDTIPNPKYWNLDWVLMDSERYSHLSDPFKTLPLWTFTGRDRQTKLQKLSLHAINHQF